MLRRCCEFEDSRLRRSPPDRASAVAYGQAGGKRNAFPPPCPQVGGCPQASQYATTTRDDFVSGNDQTSSRLPAFSLFFPGSCPNNRDRRSTRAHSGRPPTGMTMRGDAGICGKLSAPETLKGESVGSLAAGD